DVVVWGKVEDFRGRKQMTNPLVDLVGTRTGRIVAIYPQSEKGLSTSVFSDLVEEALDRYGDALSDPLPEEMRERLGMPSRAWAMRQTHRPESIGSKEAGRRRLGFDELLRLQTILVMRKRSFERDAKGLSHDVQGRLVGRFTEGLPFPLTSSQKSAIGEIRSDLARPIPMHRLLQGDVGSGKTVVALAAMLVAVEAGHQAALMVPTEVLAEQHYAALQAMVGGLRVRAGEGTLFAASEADVELRVELLTSRLGESARRDVLKRLGSGEANIVVGTHALLTEDVALASLGLVVIDEQHRFGVEQRAALREKGAGGVIPDVLVMTATPIPRTAAMTVFGDIDTTILSEMPPGRIPIMTVWARDEEAEQLAWERILA
ncbi:MAG: DEAD/DEAH box helicase, partial [Acidimicrobiales bacterium]